MGNLSAFNKTESATVTAIYDMWKKRGDSETQRGYLGASIIGHDCDRYLWYSFRQCVPRKLDGRMYRLFNAGHCAEPRFVADLKAIGCEVHEVGEDGQQIGVEAIDGHFRGHLDGVALGIPEAPKTWHVLEFKTHGDDSFKKLVADGVKKSKPMHYAQMMVYMGLTKLTRSLYLAVNKDTEELYSERIEFNAAEFKGIMARAERIIRSTSPCERVSDRADHYKCKWCDAKEVCWGGAVSLPIPANTCRVCCYATPIEDGCWKCEKGEVFGKPCDKHMVIPTMLEGCKIEDSYDDYITMSNNGKSFVIGHRGITTEDLMKLPLATLPEVYAVKKGLGAMVIGFEVPELNLLEKYDPKDSRLVWEGKPGDCPRQDGKITGVLKNAYHEAEEYDGNYLRVIYIGKDYAAIWEGVE